MEGVGLEIFTKHSKSFIIGTIYRPPDSNKHLSKKFNEILVQTITKANDEKKGLLIIGDLNYNYLDKKHCPDLKEQLKLNGFVQVIKEPTRVTENCETLTGLILSTYPERLTDAIVIPSADSDHDLIGCKCEV